VKRTGILRSAELMVSGKREEEYGSPEENFAVIAELWTTAFAVKFTSEDVAKAMILLKVARLMTGMGSDDTWIDIAGYAAIGGEISQ